MIKLGRTGAVCVSVQKTAKEARLVHGTMRYDLKALWKSPHALETLNLPN